MSRAWRRAWALLLLSLLALAGPARAHGFHAEARQEGGELVLEAYFSDGSPPPRAEVVVRREGVEVARGQCDARGAWRYRPERSGRYRLEVTEPGEHTAVVECDVLLEGAAGARGPAQAASPPPPHDQERPGRILAGLAVIGAVAAALALVQRRGAS